MKFAVIETGSKQYKVKEGDLIKVEKISGTKKDISFDKVLLFSDEAKVLIGKPYLKDSHVEAEILETKKGNKIYVERFKPKIRYHKKKGHRQWQTKLKITRIGSTS
ncbi:50S ribosomal protein L21 [bacterium (Candidatus Moisslbacteria) CG12_big_fil_rev_8_21_14_0_65_36_11]|nr:50S ribosomal protein L21 [Candidatus Kuenenbacteria bacterium]OIP76827.1 MAG: 50S ribosomal protein L21 [Parcubacteria group bacterium CG2_30_36_38]PIW67743.1 MAG: 50S ribosomal protein L21 [bacterium (Candidatus Moisslbacteria) CG12_big_fil_rev_8_21_14_0_65_36_11]PIZ90314.1 MAG: 50S ribosomal protein L21 [bacterium (Candidatus Moisslbacteria) CG_4_10_14_0_2_um_filter_36_61]PJC00855.1 MAG: 50S ribosomal protein L21 [bacterium (Candidatus Moisslbacteria) CG_4_9_14_0_8_um_filter_36_20]